MHAPDLWMADIIFVQHFDYDLQNFKDVCQVIFCCCKYGGLHVVDTARNVFILKWHLH